MSLVERSPRPFVSLHDFVTRSPVTFGSKQEITQRSILVRLSPQQWPVLEVGNRIQFKISFHLDFLALIFLSRSFVTKFFLELQCNKKCNIFIYIYTKVVFQSIQLHILYPMSSHACFKTGRRLSYISFGIFGALSNLGNLGPKKPNHWWVNTESISNYLTSYFASNNVLRNLREHLRPSIINFFIHSLSSQFEIEIKLKFN